MTELSNGHNEWRTQPMYTFSEAGHLAHVAASTVRNWLFGYTGRYGEAVPPLFEAPGGSGAMVSFLQLIEVVVAGNFRKAERVSFRTVRRAYENAKAQWGIDYPFAHLRLEALGGHIVQRFRTDRPGRSLQALDEPLQWTLPGLVLETLAQLDYEFDLAARWYPVGKAVHIVVDPKITSGLPTIVGRGVTVEVIHQRFKAGQRLEYIAQDFALDATLVEEAVRYGERVVA